MDIVDIVFKSIVEQKIENTGRSFTEKEVADIITENISSIYGNPSSLHEIGLQSRNIINYQITFGILI